MDYATYGQFALALIFVLGLIWVLTVIARRAGLGPRIATGRGAKRLAIVEVMPLDAKRRLVLVRRDDVDHLLLLGVTHDLVVEADIPAQPSGSGRPLFKPTEPIEPTLS